MAEKVLLSYTDDKRGINKPLLKKELNDFVVYQIIPDRFIESGKTVEDILTTISAMKDPFLQFRDKCVILSDSKPIFYEIAFMDGKITFNYVMPDKYETVLTNKIGKIFRTATLKKIDDYFPSFADGCYANYLQKQHFMFSLNTDYRENGLIDGILAAVNNIKKEDRVLLQIGIQPLDDGWKEKWTQSYLRYQKGDELQVSNSIPTFIFDNVFKFGDSLFGIMDMIVGVDKTKSKDDVKMMRQMENMQRGGFSSYTYKRLTTQKVTQNGYMVQLRMYCDNASIAYYYSKVFSGIFKVLDGEQQLEVNGFTKRVKKAEREFNYQVNKNIFCTKELSMFLQLPNRRMQLDYKENMPSIESIETVVPEKLRKGIIPIGWANYKGENFLTYWNTNDYDMAPMHRVITGLQRTGKSSYIKNFAIKAMEAGHSVFVIDTIKTCEVANDIRDYMPAKYADKVIVLDYSNLERLLPLAWNEVKLDDSMTRSQKMMVSSRMSGAFESFLNTVNADKNCENLSPRMMKYLSSAVKCVMSQPNTSLKDVIDCLVEYDARHKFIDSCTLDKNSMTIQELLRLDEVDEKKKIYGTKYSEISHIMDRVSTLLNDYTMELMLSTKPNPDIDFAKWANEGYCVLIKISELDFSRTTLRTLVTYLYSKIWLAMLNRGKDIHQPRITHVILDEIHNFPEVCEMLKGNCREAAKFGLSYLFTAHLLKDLKGLLPYIKGSGGNFMMFKTTKENFVLMKEELELLGFELDECMKLKDYHTLNYVNYDRDYVAFISKVVDPVDRVYVKTDRAYMDKRFSDRFGVVNLD